jgi:6-phosphofructokinase
MGIAAVEAIVAGESNLVICERDTEIETVDISLALAIQKYHHGKLSEEELAKMKKEDREFVKKIVERRRSVTKKLYEAAADICM